MMKHIIAIVAVVLVFAALQVDTFPSRAERAGSPRRNESPAPAPAHHDAALRPNPQLTPEQVVRYQLRALKENTDDNRGISHCFEFASPANRQFSGPLEGFIAMVKLPPYDVLLNHKMALVGKADIRGVETDLLVTLIDKQHRLCVFSFVLSRQHGPEYANCWMTDGVTRIDMDADRHDRSLEPASEERRL